MTTDVGDGECWPCLPVVVASTKRPDSGGRDYFRANIAQGADWCWPRVHAETSTAGGGVKRQQRAGSWPAGFMDDPTSDCLVADDSVEGFKDGVPLNAWELEDVLYGYFRPWDELAMLFSKYDHTGFGEMSIDNFRTAVYEPDFRSQVVDLTDPVSLTRLEYRTANPMPVTYQEFVDLVSNKRRRSFNSALSRRCDHEIVSLTASCSDDDMADGGVSSPHQPSSSRSGKLPYYCIASQSPDANKQPRLQYRCWPPPLVIPAVTALQIALFVFYALEAKENVWYTSGAIPIESVLIYRSDLRRQTWRFLTYALVHAGYWHLIFNLTVQILIGLPLEMVHGNCKVAFVYLSGILAGSFATSIFDPDVFLVGASGAVYAILAAHVANVLVNFTRVDCGILWIVISLLVASFDVAFAIWDRYVRVAANDHPVSYAAHLAGSLSGLLLGLLLLRRNCEKDATYVWPLAILVYGVLIGAAVIWNVLY